MEDLPDLSPAGRERIARFKSRKESILSILQTPKVVKKKQGSWAKLPEMILIAIWSRCLISHQMQYPILYNEQSGSLINSVRLEGEAIDGDRVGGPPVGRLEREDGDAAVHLKGDLMMRQC